MVSGFALALLYGYYHGIISWLYTCLKRTFIGVKAIAVCIEKGYRHKGSLSPYTGWPYVI
jgi:hypothetical protein